MAIPFKSLRFPRGADQTWGVNFRRIVRDRPEFSYLVPIPASAGPRGIMRVSLAPPLVGVTAPPPGLNLEVKPFGIVQTQLDKAATIPPDDFDGDAGFDVKYGVTQEPDGGLHLQHRLRAGRRGRAPGQPHAVQPVLPRETGVLPRGAGHLRLRRRAERARRAAGAAQQHAGPLLQPSHRHQRGCHRADRRRGTPHAGRRGRGASGSSTCRRPTARSARACDELRGGAREARHPAPQRGRGDCDQPVRARSRTRARTRSSASTRNFAFYENVSIVGYFARSWTTDLDGDDASYRGQFDYSGDRYGFEVEHLLVDENFNPEVGFLRREAFRRSFAQARFSPRPKSVPWIRKWGIEPSFDYITDPGGVLESRQAQLTGRIDFSNGDNFGLDFERNFEALDEPFEITDEVTIPGRRVSVRQPPGAIRAGAAAAGQWRGVAQQRRVLRRHAAGDRAGAGASSSRRSCPSNRRCRSTGCGCRTGISTPSSSACGRT